MIASRLKKIAADQRSLWVIIFVGSLVVRFVAIQSFINVDEDDWMRWGLHFIEQFAELDFAETYQWHHPGVTTMWVNGIGLTLYCFFHGQQIASDVSGQSLQVCSQYLLDQPGFPLAAYAITRSLQAVITSGCMAYLFVQMRRLLGQPIALLGIGLLTFEPFFLAYQRLTVTDGFQTDFMALAIVLLLLYLRGDGGRRLLVGSGIWMGLAIATKTPALVILPAIAVWIALIELRVWRTRFPQRGWLRQAIDLVAWGAVLAVTVFVIFPALWVAPIETLGQLAADLKGETGRGYFFFLGQMTDAPGLLFYPVVLLYRLSPVLLIGSAIGLVMLILPRLRRSLLYAPELTALALVAVSVLLVLSASDNKIDRYIIPTIPALAFLAAAGWLQAVSWLAQQTQTIRQKLKTVAIALLMLIQLAILVPHYPYYLTYFNPLLGGLPAAERLLMVGIGEGMDQAAEWLNQLPNAKALTVGSWYSPTFAPYFHGKTLEIGRQAKTASDRRWLREANYVVLYINQFQRQLPTPELLKRLTTEPPLHTVKLHGVDYVQIYPGPKRSPA